MQHLEPATRPPARAPLARWIRGSAAVLLTLAAPAVAISGALTTGLNGTSPAVGFPPGCTVTLLFNWLISGTATVLTNPPTAGNTTPPTVATVLGGYTVVLLAAATWLVRRRDVA
jgi:hypothetical protein